MRVCLLLALLVAFIAATQAFEKCCPEPESEGKCDCCPDACCCLCESTLVPGTPGPTAAPASTRMSTTSTTCELGGLDVIFIVDASLSVGTGDWAVAMEFLGELVAVDAWDSVGDKTRFGMITFSTEGDLIWGILDAESNSVSSLQASFNAVPFVGGGTNTPDGLHIAANQFENNDRDDQLFPDVAIVVADGLTNRNRSLLAGTVERLQDVTSLVYAIGISDATNYTMLNAIADGENNESVSFVGSFAELLGSVEMIVETLKTSICTFVTEAPGTVPTDPPTTTPAPAVVEVCECCCPPLPDPCELYPNSKDPCCCRFDGDKKKRR